MTDSHLTHEGEFGLMMYYKRYVAKISLFIGMPILCAVAIYNFIEGGYFVAILSCVTVLTLGLLGFVLMRRIEEKLEYKIYSILFRLFVAAIGIALLYGIGFLSNFSRIEWCYIYPILAFFAVGLKEGMIWVSIFYGILAFFILNFDLQGITLFQIQELRTRFLVSLFVVSTLSFFLEYGFRRAQQRLLHHQRDLQESENRYRQAYEQLNIQMKERERAEEALRESEEKYRLVVENSKEAILVVQGRTLKFANQAAEEIWGYSREELTARPFADFIHPYDQETVIGNYQKRLRGEALPPVYSFRVVDRDGKAVWVELNAVIITWNGKPAALYFLRDITERIKMERELAHTRILLQSAFEQTPVPMVLVSAPDGVFLNVNRACVEMLGFEDEGNPKGQSMMGFNQTWQILDAEGKRVPRTELPLALALQGMTTRNREFCVLRKNGTRRWIIAGAAPIYSEPGEMIAAFEVFPDITERKHAEDMLRESESRFRNLVENSLTGIYIMQGGQIVYKNSEQDKIFGTLPQPENFNHFKNVHPEDAEKVKEFYEKIMAGEIRNFDIDIRFFPSGEMDDTADMRCVHSLASVIEYQGREAILINMMDVTRTRELEHLIRIDDKMTSLGRAAAGIIHELRNPLSGINVYLTALKKIYNQPDRIESESLDKVDGIIEKMQSASNKIESVIKRVMDFSKPSIPRLTLTDINHSIQEAIGLSSATFRKHGIRIETSLRDDLPQCFTDSHLIEQVLLNLIMNAGQAMENTAGEKIIEITSSVEGNFVLIRVADSGPGVPPVLRKKIFDPFFTTKKDSSGIGLSVCYRIMADHGGSLNVVTSKWGGAEFRVSIPIEKRKGIR